MDPLDPLADLWRSFADGIPAEYCPIYKEIARSVAEDRELLALQHSARPHAHLPRMLMAGAHHLLLSGIEHPLADVYAGRSSVSPGPLFRDLCLRHRGALVDVLDRRTVQTNEVGRSALLGPALTWAAGGQAVQLVDVGCSAGLNLFCDRYRLDYGEHGATGPEDSPVRIECRVVGGSPPIAPSLPVIAGRVGIDLDPPDLTDPDDARWLLSCVWPGTGRFQREARAIAQGSAEPPPVVRGDALELLPDLLGGLDEGQIVLFTSWSLYYFSPEQRRALIELLGAIGRSRPLVWLCLDAPESLDLLSGEELPVPDAPQHDVLSGVTFEGGSPPRATVLAFVQSHGQSMTWKASHSRRDQLPPNR